MTWTSVLASLILIASATLALADADTIRVNGVTYRLDGIDAPEIDQTCLSAAGPSWPCGKDAHAALLAFIEGKTLRCEDVGPDTRYPRRRIGLCHVGDTELNSWLVLQGWAINFEPYARGRFLSDEADARQNQRGMWAGCFVTPRDFRRWNNRTAALFGHACPTEPDRMARTRRLLFPEHKDMPILEDGTRCEIKGSNRWDPMGYRGIYHLPGCGSYAKFKKVSRWFCSEEHAQAEQFRKALNCWKR